jgi:hypothetical protein
MDGVTVTVGNPRIQAERIHSWRQDKALLKFTVTVENKSNKPLELGLVYISVESGNKAASEVSTPWVVSEDLPIPKCWRAGKSQFEVGFAVADPRDVMTEVALHKDVVPPTALYST